MTQTQKYRKQLTLIFIPLYNFHARKCSHPALLDHVPSSASPPSNGPKFHPQNSPFSRRVDERRNPTFAHPHTRTAEHATTIPSRTPASVLSIHYFHIILSLSAAGPIHRPNNEKKKKKKEGPARKMMPSTIPLASHPSLARARASIEMHALEGIPITHPPS